MAQQLAHIEEGYAYHDGESRQLYDPGSAESAAQLFQQQCLTWSYSGLEFRACVDLSVPSVTLTVTLVGFQIANCTLNATNPTCTVGGSVGFVKAELTATFQPSPRKLTVHGELCGELAEYCASFSHTFDF